MGNTCRILKVRNDLCYQANNHMQPVCPPWSQSHKINDAWAWQTVLGLSCFLGFSKKPGQKLARRRDRDRGENKGLIWPS